MLTLTASAVAADEVRRGLTRRAEIALPLMPADVGTAVAAQDADLLADLGIDVDRRLRRAEATGRAGEVIRVELERDRPEAVHLVGVGDGGPGDLRRAGAALGGALRGRSAAACCVAAAAPDGVRAFVEGMLIGSALPRRIGARGATSRPGRVTVAVTPDRAGEAAEAVRRAAVTAEAVDLARDLATTPSDVKDPAWMVGRARAVAGDAGLTVDVWDPVRLAREGFGGLLAVGAGSARGPYLVRLDHRPAARTHVGGRVALVGKGVTFDSGGLSLKPADAMTAMKTDMAGAAAVLAVMSALPRLGVRVRVTALLALAENLPGAAAMRPGDVVRHYGGRTTEVLNTDAEGRLVLADALAYVDRHLDAETVVDVATLTGAATAALGRSTGALLTPDDGLAEQLAQAGAAAGEPVWRLPLVADHADALDSDIADAANVSRDPYVGGGAIVAAWFLRPFAGDRAWAHLDIAGPARYATDRPGVSAGATGFGTRLLLRWLEGAGIGGV